jgi:hypothetical protein
VTLLKGQGIEIKDLHDGDRTAELSLMFAAKPTIDDGVILLPDLARIVVEGARQMRLDEIPVSDARLRKAWPDRLYRVRIPLAGNRLRLWIS